MSAVSKRNLRFCCEDLTRIPPAAPEAAGSLLSLFEVLSKQQRQLTQMEKSLTSLGLEVMKNTEKIDNVGSNMGSNMGSSKGSNVVASNGSSYAGALHTQPGPSNQILPRNAAVRSKVMPSEASNSVPQVNLPVWNPTLQHDTDDNTSFQTVHGNGKRPLKGLRKQPKKGTAETAEALASGPESFHIQLTNVSPKITKDRIAEYIKEKDDSVVIDEIQDTSSEGWETKRFLLSMNTEFFDVLMNDQFWPKGIYYKQWFKIKPKVRSQPGLL